MAKLTDTVPLELGSGITLLAPGLSGEVELSPPNAASLARQVGTPEAIGAELNGLLTAAGLKHLTRPVELRVTDVSDPEGTTTLTAARPAEAGSTAAVLLIADDDSGVLTWHFPERLPSHPGLASDSTLTFRIPNRRLAVPSGAEADGNQGLLPGGRIVKKLMSVLVYPIAESLVGLAAEAIARAWEQDAHPYAARQLIEPVGDEPQWATLSDAGWRALSGKRVLLLLHGIFSSCVGSFHSMAPATFQSLAERYHAVIAFDHPTVSVDPAANAKEFLSRIPPGVTLELDVLCHSRGGLVARILSGELSPVPELTVGKIVFVGTPNSGTVLVEPGNLEQLVNRFSSLLRVLPPGPWTMTTTVFQAILELVKLIGMGIEIGLPGLAAMQPHSELLSQLNTGPAPGTSHYAISTNFEPTGSLSNVLRDAAVDLVFRNVANDVAVPTAGVGAADSDAGFPVPPDNAFTFAPGQVWHCSYFGQPETQDHVLAWLSG